MTFPHTNITSSSERSLFNSKVSSFRGDSSSRSVLKANATTARYLMQVNCNLRFQIDKVSQHIAMTKEAFARITADHNCKWYFDQIKVMNTHLKQANELLQQKAKFGKEQLLLNIREELKQLTQAKNTAFVCENALHKKNNQICQLKKLLMNINVIRENRKEVYDDDKVYTKEQRKDMFQSLKEYFQEYLGWYLSKVTAVKKANDKKEEIVKKLKRRVQQEKNKVGVGGCCESEDDEECYDIVNVGDSDNEREDEPIWTNISLDDNNISYGEGNDEGTVKNNTSHYDYYVHSRIESGVAIPKLDLKQIEYNNDLKNNNSRKQTKITLKIRTKNHQHAHNNRSMAIINDLPFAQLH